MVRWRAGAAALILAAALGAADGARAADQAVAHRPLHATGHRSAAYAGDCGCCGCWYPEYVRHRQILYTYPSDPRYTLTSEPRYVPGRMRLSVRNLF